MSGPTIVAIGASAGGVEAVSSVVAGLPADLDAAVLVVIHVPPSSESVLPSILTRAGRLPAVHPTDRQRLEPGQVYVAPPNEHLIVEDGHLRLRRSARVHGLRPAIDPLFAAVADVAGPRSVGVILSGTLDDGSLGLRLIKEAGGVAVVQDPETALYPDMPRNALVAIDADEVAEVDALAPLIIEHVQRLADAAPVVSGGSGHPGEAGDGPQPGAPTGYTCPRCHGALWEDDQHGVLRYRCRVGHAWGEASLSQYAAEQVEEALWTALRSIEEKVALTRRLAANARQRGQSRMADRFTRYADRLAPQAEVMHQLIADLDEDPSTSTTATP